MWVPDTHDDKAEGLGPQPDRFQRSPIITLPRTPQTPPRPPQRHCPLCPVPWLSCATSGRPAQSWAPRLPCQPDPLHRILREHSVERTFNGQWLRLPSLLRALRVCLEPSPNSSKWNANGTYSQDESFVLITRPLHGRLLCLSPSAGRMAFQALLITEKRRRGREPQKGAVCSNEPKKLIKMTPSSFWNPRKDSKRQRAVPNVQHPWGLLPTANMVEAPSPHLQLQEEPPDLEFL